MQVQEDVAQYGPMIEKMAGSIRKEKPADMDALMAFVSSTDQQLGVLFDEHATLKFFEWPEAKHDCFREAAALHLELFELKVKG